MPVSRLLRHIHMYLALFLTPWLLMYTLSTFCMNHLETFREIAGGELQRFEVESEQEYTAVFSREANRQQVAEQILSDLGIEGGYVVRGNLKSKQMTIERSDPLNPRRLTYYPETGVLRVERINQTSAAWLKMFHRRRGYDKDILIDDAWAFSVDLVIVAMIFWIISGVWLWWELVAIRRIGAVILLVGSGIFLFLVCMI
jgi:hypothetical protein